MPETKVAVHLSAFYADNGDEDRDAMVLLNGIPIPMAKVQQRRSLKAHSINFYDASELIIANENTLFVRCYSIDRKTCVFVHTVTLKTRQTLVDEIISRKSCLTNVMQYTDAEDTLMQMMRVSLLCPLGMRRVQIPAKSLICTHARCFDLETYLEVCHTSHVWECPICLTPCNFSVCIKKDADDQSLIKIISLDDRCGWIFSKNAANGTPRCRVCAS